MSGGLLALLDDVAAIAKVAAASLDDAVAQAAKAGSKAAGVVIDDAAVTPRYVVGFAADRELPIVARIARGSLRNKLFYLLPAALLLSAFAPFLITPLLMAGGAFLCFEGYEKLHEWFAPKAAPAAAEAAASAADVGDARALEDAKVAGAIRTDMILSAEIMAISLAAIETTSIWMQALTLGVVAVLVTAGVYGAVALIVKADDVGVALAQSRRPVSGFRRLFRRGREALAFGNGAPTAADARLAPFTQAVGRGLVAGMPGVLATLSVIGTLAMLWVGGGILVHGLAHYGVAAPEHTFAAAGALVGNVVPLVGGFVGWLVTAGLAGVVGVVAGWIVERVVHLVRG